MKHDDIKSALDKNRVYGAVLKETPQERTKDQGWIDADGCQNADLQWTLQKKETQNTLLVPDSKDFIKNQGWSHLNSSNHQDDQDALIIWEQDGSRKKRTIWKNVLIVGLGFFFFFTGMSPMTLMQSSLNSEDGIGVAALAVKNAFMILGSLAATSILFKFGCKWTMVIAGFIYSIYVMANFYPTWYTMIPAACLSGTAATVLWTAQRVYFAKLAHLYSSIFDMDVDRVQSRMFMLLTICFKLSATVGNAVSSVILGTQSYQNFMSSARLLICGAVYCNEEFEPSSSSSSSPPTSVNSTLGNVKDLYEPGQLQVYGLCAFCLVCCLLGSSILSFIDPLKNLGLCETPKHSKSLKTLVVEAACQMKDPRHILLIPLAMMASGGDSFWAADFSKAFITCAIGMQFIGYVSVWNGISGAFSSLVFGWFNKKKVRTLPFAFCTLIQMAVLTIMFYWRPNLNNYLHMSLFAVFWFLGSGVRFFVTPAFYATIFRTNVEAAFSLYHIWAFGASTLVFAWSNLLCMSTKMYFLLGLLGVSFLGYLLVEIIEIRKTDYQKIVSDCEMEDDTTT